MFSILIFLYNFLSFPNFYHLYRFYINGTIYFKKKKENKNNITAEKHKQQQNQSNV